MYIYRINLKIVHILSKEKFMIEGSDVILFDLLTYILSVQPSSQALILRVSYITVTYFGTPAYSTKVRYYRGAPRDSMSSNNVLERRA